MSSSLHASSIAVQIFQPSPFVYVEALLLPWPWEYPDELRSGRRDWPIRAGPRSSSEQRALLQVFLN